MIKQILFWRFYELPGENNLLIYNGRVICDRVTHNPITILDGRDGTELKKWLENNKHIKTVTRDRAGAYASAISQVIPDAI